MKKVGSDMKKIFIITWRRLIIPCLLIILTVGILIFQRFFLGDVLNVSNVNTISTYFKPDKPAEGSIEEIYQDVFITLLLPYIEEAVTDYYEKNTGYSPSVDPWEPDIISIARPKGYRTFLFVIKLEVSPFLGAHNSIGVDRLTIRVSSGEIKVEEFEHIKDFPIPPWLQ